MLLLARVPCSLQAFQSVVVEALPPSIASVAWHNHGLSLVEVGRDREAAIAFSRCLDALPSHEQRRVEVEMKLGDAYARLGEWMTARQAYERAVSLAPKNIKAARNAASAIINAGDDAEIAVTLLEQIDIADDGVLAHLALARAHAGDMDGARAAVTAHGVGLTESLFASMLLDTAGYSELAVCYLERAVWPQSHPQLSSAYYRLTRLYVALERNDEATAVRRKAVASGVWLDEWQHPGFVVPALRHIKPRPWIDEDLISPGGIFAPLSDLVRGLEDPKVCHVIAEEWRHASTMGKPLHVVHDDEAIARNNTSWHRVVLKDDGQWLPQNLEHFPSTVAALHAFVEGGRLAYRLPKGSILISVFKPEADLQPHCGPSNHRIRLHLTLDAPPPPLAAITVGNPAVPENTRPHIPCKVLLFDDAFLHAAFNRGQQDRVVLLIDVWHPALNESSRDLVRDHFFYRSDSHIDQHRLIEQHESHP